MERVGDGDVGDLTDQSGLLDLVLHLCPRPKELFNAGIVSAEHHYAATQIQMGSLLHLANMRSRVNSFNLPRMAILSLELLSYIRYAPPPHSITSAALPQPVFPLAQVVKLKH